MNLTIKPIDESDLENICILWNNSTVMSMVGFKNGLGISNEEVKVWVINYKKQTNAMRYAIYHDELGFCGETAYTKRGDAYDMDIKVLPHVQGKGIGRHALIFAMDSAFKDGASKLSVTPFENNKKSVNLYLSLGFKVLKKMEASELNISNPNFAPPCKYYIKMELER